MKVVSSGNRLVIPTQLTLAALVGYQFQFEPSPILANDLRVRLGFLNLGLSDVSGVMLPEWGAIEAELPVLQVSCLAIDLHLEWDFDTTFIA